MKILAYLFCLIIGHNKILESKKSDRFTVHHTKCSQCEKIWYSKKLSATPKIKFKKQTIKMRTQKLTMTKTLLPVLTVQIKEQHRQ